MPAKIAQLEIDFVTNLAKFTDDMRGATREAEKTAKSIQSTMSNAWKGIAGAAATAGLGMVFTEMIKNAAEAEDAMAQVQATLRSTGGASGMTAQAVSDLSAKMKELTALDDDAVTSMQSVLLTFTKVGKEVFPAATQAIADMSVKMGMDLKQAAVQVGKALNDPVKGVAALRKEGVSFSASQQQLINNLVATNRTMDAQKIILREMQTEFGGSAAAARDTMGGALKALEVRVGDLFQALAGEGGGLRYGLELVITGVENTTAAITDLQKAMAAGAAQPEFISGMGAVAQAGNAVWNIVKSIGNAAVEMGITLEEEAKGLERFAKSTTSLFSLGLSDQLNGFGKGIGKSLGDAFWDMGDNKKAKSITDNVSKAMGASGKDWIGDALKPLSDGWAKWEQETKARIDKLHKEASKATVKTAMPDGDASDPKAAKKAADELERQRKTLADLLHDYQRQASGIGEVTAQQKILNDQMEQEYKISGMLKVPLKERLAAINEIAQITKQKLETERLAGIEKEKKALKSVLEDMQAALQSSKDKTAEQEELIPLLEAEKKIREIQKDYSAENLDLVKQIRQVAQDQSAEELNKQHKEGLKTLKDITDEWDAQTDALQRQLNGQEELNKLLEAEKKIRETKGLSNEEKEAAVKHIRDQDQKSKDYNKTLAAHKKVIDDITGSGLKQKAQVEALEKAYKAGDITAKEWADTMNQITKESNKAQSAAGSFASTITNALDKMISGGGKFKGILGDIVKDLLKITSKTLLTDPLQKGLTGLFSRLFGGGGQKAAQTPGWMPPGVSYGTNPYTGLPSYTAGPGGTGTAGGSLPGLSPAAGIAVPPQLMQGAMQSALTALTKAFHSFGGPQILQQYPAVGKIGFGLGTAGAAALGGVTGGLPGIMGILQSIPQAYSIFQRATAPAFPMMGGLGGATSGSASGGGFLSGLGGLFGGLNPFSLLTKQFLPISPGQKMSLGGYGMQFLKALLPGFERGGMAMSGQPFIAGENGAELIWPDQDMRVYNASETQRLTPFIGDWVPQARAKGIRDAGVDPEIYEMKQLNDYALAHPEARGDTMKKYYEAMDRWGMKGNQYEAEAKELAEQHMKNNARQLFNENPGPGSGGFGLAQQIAGSVLANQSQSIIGLRMGKLMLNAGNALETIDSMGGASEGFRRYASSSDWLSQWSYNPDNVFDPKNFGFSYNSMGIGGNNRNATAYGGDGHQAAFQDWLGERAGQLSQGNADRWSQVMRNYTGQHFIGGGPNIISTGIGVNGTGRGPIVQPHYDNREWPLPPSARQMTDYELFRERSLKMGNVDPGPTPPPGWDKMNPVKNLNRLDTIQYQNQYGTIKGFTAAAYPAMMAAVENLPEIKYNGRPLGGSLSPGMMGYQLSGELFTNEAPSNGANAFGRWPTDPITAGQVHAGMTYGGKRAQGGKVEKNTLYTVLENGNEMFIPDRGGRIVPLNGNGGGFGGEGARVTVHPAAGVDTETVTMGRDVTIFQRARVGQDLANGTTGRLMSSLYGVRPKVPRRG